MKNIVKTNYQVIIIGGDYSAITLAIEFAKKGYSILFIEPTINICGDLCGYKLQNEFISNYKINNEIYRTGIFNELFSKYNNLNTFISSWFCNSSFNQIIIELFEEYKIKILLNTIISKIQIDNNLITHLIITNGEVKNVVETKLVIDCSTNSYSLKLMDQDHNLNYYKNKTLIYQLSQIDLVDTLFDVRENPEKYNYVSTKKYSTNEFIILEGYKNIAQKYYQEESLRFVFPPGNDETILSTTIKLEEQFKINELVDDLRRNAAGFKNVKIKNTKTLKNSYLNQKDTIEIQNKLKLINDNYTVEILDETTMKITKN